MTDTAGPFDGTPWAEAQWARHAAVWAPSGVYGAPATSTTTGDLPLSVSGLSVGLGSGRAWVRGFGFERSGGAVMQAVTANTHASFNRRDRIVLRRNLATHTLTPVLITGTPASPPVAPALTQADAGSWDLPMFSFLVPPASGTTITGIVDERSWVDPDQAPAGPVSFGPSFQANVANPLKTTRAQNGMVAVTGLVTNSGTVFDVAGTWCTVAHPPALREYGLLAYVEGVGIATYDIRTDGAVVGTGWAVGGPTTSIGRYWSINATYKGA